MMDRERRKHLYSTSKDLGQSGVTRGKMRGKQLKGKNKKKKTAQSFTEDKIIKRKQLAIWAF